MPLSFSGTLAIAQCRPQMLRQQNDVPIKRCIETLNQGHNWHTDRTNKVMMNPTQAKRFRRGFVYCGWQTWCGSVTDVPLFVILSYAKCAMTHTYIFVSYDFMILLFYHLYFLYLCLILFLIICIYCMNCFGTRAPSQMRPWSQWVPLDT